MNAIEFVKHIGFGYAKKVVDAFESVTETNGEKMKISRNDGEGFEIDFDDIKRLVEAHELVMEHGSLERAKKYSDSPYTAPEIKAVLDKAITDVESCQ